MTSAVFNSDGTRLATASLDGVIKLWDIQKQREQQGLKRQASSVWCVALHLMINQFCWNTHWWSIIPAPEAVLLPLPPTPVPTPTPTSTPCAPQAELKPLMVTKFKSQAGATGVISNNGTVLVSGKKGKDIYSVTAVVPGPAVTAICLEVLPDKTLPAQGRAERETATLFLVIQCSDHICG